MTLLPFSHQREAFNTLLTRAKLYFGHRWLDFPVRPRFHSLIVGPTGTGKSTIAALVAVAMGTGTKFLRVSVPEWIPMGAHNRGSTETLPTILKQLEDASNLVLFLDEVDKLWDANASWQEYARAEIFDLLDGKIPLGIKLSDEADTKNPTELRLRALARKVSQRTFIVAAGTFQSNWESTQKSPIGFNHTRASSDHASLSLEAMAKRIPRELLNRFHSQNLTLRPLLHSDYEELVRSTVVQLPQWIRATFVEIASSRIEQALESHKGCRFVEEALLLALQVTSEKDEASCAPAP